MIKYLLSILLMLSFFSSHADEIRATNFAFGGATTNTQNATALFAPELDDAAGAIGLELVGLTQQLDFAEATLHGINSERDVFWLWVGTNNILIGALTNNPDPTAAPTELKAAMTRLYARLGARIFIVPNLMLLGNLPQFNQDPSTQAAINGLTLQQNGLLAQAMNEFQNEHPDATVITLDIQNLFLQLDASGEFSNTTEACFTSGLPSEIACNQYLYADDIHFTSAAASKMVNLTLPKLTDIDVRRLVVLGDSFVDTGGFFNTIERATGKGFPGFPFFQGRFSDGPNVIDQLESQLNLELKSSAFVQPVRTSITEGSNALTADVIVPARLNVINESRFGIVSLNFPGKGLCIYLPDWRTDDFRRLSLCSGGLKAGETIHIENVSLSAPFSNKPVTADLFHY